MRPAPLVLVVLAQMNTWSAAAAVGDEVSAPLSASARRALPADVPDTAVERALRAGVWDPTGKAVAISVPRVRGSVVFAFIPHASGGFLSVDLSAVERANLGKLGNASAVFDKVETRPVQWMGRSDGSFQVVVRTRAWKSGRRFTVSEPLLIRPDGTVVWR